MAGTISTPGRSPCPTVPPLDIPKGEIKVLYFSPKEFKIEILSTGDPIYERAASS